MPFKQFLGLGRPSPSFPRKNIPINKELEQTGRDTSVLYKVLACKSRYLIRSDLRIEVTAHYLSFGESKLEM